MYLICMKELEGFTIGKPYKLLGCCGGEYIKLKDDDKETAIVYEGYFKIQ